MIVEMACLYTSCEWPSRRSSTQKLSNQVTTPCSFTPFTRKIVSGVLFLRTWLRKVSCRFCERSAAIVAVPFFCSQAPSREPYCQVAVRSRCNKWLCPFSSLALSTALGRRHYRAGLQAAQAQVGGRECPYWGENVRFQENSAWRWNCARRAVATEPGAPLPIGWSSIRTTGMTIWLAEVRNASRAP